MLGWFKGRQSDKDRISKQKDLLFERLAQLIWDHGVFVDSKGNSEPGKYDKKQISDLWQRFHDINNEQKELKSREKEI